MLFCLELCSTLFVNILVSYYLEIWDISGKLDTSLLGIQYIRPFSGILAAF